jgi:hypothetical protein
VTAVASPIPVLVPVTTAIAMFARLGGRCDTALIF